MYGNIVILTGAGISAESGLATFRGAGGMWEGNRIEEVASPQAFSRSPDLVQKFYNMRRQQLLSGIEPNDAHIAIAEFEKTVTLKKCSFLLVTQNVDDLHERAGSSNILHMHGELLKARSTSTGEVITCRNDLAGTAFRPHIVWFGEMPFEMDRIQQALNSCDLFVSIGTSGHVYPAAGFVEAAVCAGAHTVEINLEPGIQSTHFQERIIGPASTCVPDYMTSLLKKI